MQDSVSKLICINSPVNLILRCISFLKNDTRCWKSSNLEIPFFVGLNMKILCRLMICCQSNIPLSLFFYSKTMTLTFRMCQEYFWIKTDQAWYAVYHAYKMKLWSQSGSQFFAIKEIRFNRIPDACVAFLSKVIEENILLFSCVMKKIIPKIRPMTTVTRLPPFKNYEYHRRSIWLD